MHPGFIAITVGFLLTGVVAFFGGEWWARYDADRSSKTAMSYASVHQHAATLFILRQVLDDLRGQKLKEADTLLVRYAKLQVPQLTECAKSPQCAFWAGKLLPNEVQLNEVASMKDRP